ncbi:hypothetical protein [Dissulfurirhabdus thermomarina]|uniref:hypothetical protein n=1 Tax=Dissulfurirhabdus thermomarina TaxID=1765737 RepID=UPI0015E87C35|nr:hypothetical protein [Dissulfurirhabdus thermomarina]
MEEPIDKETAPGAGAPGPDVEACIAEEVLLIRHSGEIPEVAFHGSLHYLTEDPEGPGLVLGKAHLHRLKVAVVARYRAILLRDLDPGNRDRRLYRGVARSIWNWRRLRDFCRREGLEAEEIRREAARALEAFLRCELDDVRAGRRTSCINCPAEDLRAFARELGIRDTRLPKGWEALCPDARGPRDQGAGDGRGDP